MEKELRAFRCDAGLTPVKGEGRREKGEGREGRQAGGKSWVCGTASRKVWLGS